MQPFVLSALLSFAIYQLMAYIEILPFRGWLRVGSININFDPRAARWVKRSLLALITLAIVFGMLFVHERLSPLDAISRNRTNIVLGFLFGPLFAIWLNTVINHRIAVTGVVIEAKDPPAAPGEANAAERALKKIRVQSVKDIAGNCS